MDKKDRSTAYFVIAGVVSLLLSSILESNFQNPIGGTWLDMEPPFESTEFDVAFDSQGQDWFCSSDGLAVLSEGVWQSYNEENGEFPGECTSIAIDSQDRVWVGTNSSLMMFDGQSWQTFTTGNSGLLRDEICFLTIDPKDQAWVRYCEHQGIISIFDGDEWSSIDTGLPSVKNIVFDNLGTVWIEEEDWIEGNRLHALRNNEMEFNVLPDHEIVGICIDGNGILRAVTYHDYTHSLYAYDGSTWIEQVDLGGHSINRVVACSQDGRVAFGFHHDLWVVHEDSIDHYTDKNSPKYYGLSSLAFDHQGRLWIGEQWQTLVLSSETGTPWPDGYVAIREVTFHPNSMFVFSLLIMSLGVAVRQDVLKVTAAVVALGLIANAAAGWQLRFLFGGTYVVLGVVGSLIGGEIRKRKDAGYALPIILAIVGAVIGLFIDLAVMFMFYM